VIRFLVKPWIWWLLWSMNLHTMLNWWALCVARAQSPGTQGDWAQAVFTALRNTLPCTLPANYRPPINNRINNRVSTTYQQPEYLACKLQRHRSVRDLRSSTDLSALPVPCTRRKFAERRFAVAAPKVWNSILLDIRNCDTLNTFKKKLKTWLLIESLHVQHSDTLLLVAPQ